MKQRNDMRFLEALTMTDFLTIIGWTFTIIGLGATVVQLRNSARTEKARFLLDITDRYFRDIDSRKFYYKIDYHRWKFDPKTFSQSEDERLLDGIIYTFDVIGRMLRMGAVSVDEVQVLAFQASRVLHNEEVQKYLIWLDAEYKRFGLPVPAHADARYLGDTVC